MDIYIIKKMIHGMSMLFAPELIVFMFCELFFEVPLSLTIDNEM